MIFDFVKNKLVLFVAYNVLLCMLVLFLDEV